MLVNWPALVAATTARTTIAAAAPAARRWGRGNAVQAHTVSSIMLVGRYRESVATRALSDAASQKTNRAVSAAQNSGGGRQRRHSAMTSPMIDAHASGMPKVA